MGETIEHQPDNDQDEDDRSEHRTKSVPPEPHSLMADIDAALDKMYIVTVRLRIAGGYKTPPSQPITNFRS